MKKIEKTLKVIGLCILIFMLSWFFYAWYRELSYYMGHKNLQNRPRSYELIWGDPYDNNSSLGYSISHVIDSLKSVKWNDRMIVVEQNIDKENRWAIIKPKSDIDTILDRMQDTLIRDLTKYQIDSIISYLNADTFIVEDLKPDIIDRFYK